MQILQHQGLKDLYAKGTPPNAISRDVSPAFIERLAMDEQRPAVLRALALRWMTDIDKSSHFTHCSSSRASRIPRSSSKRFAGSPRAVGRNRPRRSGRLLATPNSRRRRGLRHWSGVERRRLAGAARRSRSRRPPRGRTCAAEVRQAARGAAALSRSFRPFAGTRPVRSW